MEKTYTANDLFNATVELLKQSKAEMKAYAEQKDSNMLDHAKLYNHINNIYRVQGILLALFPACYELTMENWAETIEAQVLNENLARILRAVLVVAVISKEMESRKLNAGPRKEDLN